MYHETKRLIKKAILENKLVLFVGAGASLNSGIPLWGDAIEQIKVNLEPEFSDEKDYLKIPQFYYNARGFKEYNELMKDIFSYVDKEPNDLHRKIFELRPSHIITTNYDNFLERIADENGEFLEIVEKDTDIPYAKNDRLLIKMHGGFNHDNYVLKEDDYLNYSNNFKLTETLIKSLIARNTVVFVGYSFNDPDTKQIFNWVKNTLGDDFQRAYMVLGREKYNQTLNDYYKNLGINLIFAEKCLGDNFDDSREKIFDNTIACLDYFIQNDNVEDLSQKLYMELQQYENLNFLKLSYISNAFNATNSNWQVRIEGNTLIFINDDGFEFYRKLMDSDNVYAKKVANILSKSQLFYVTLNSNLGSNTENKLEIKSTEESELNPEFWKFIEEMDYIKLKNIVENIDIYDAKLPLSTKLEAAYFYYKTNNMQKASNILGEISKLCKKQKNYLWHFITEFDIKYINRQNWTWFGISNQKQNLQEIIFKYNLYSDENNFLLDISNFSLFHNAHYNANEILKKIPDDNITFNIQEVHKLEYYVMDIYNFMRSNYLMIEKFSDIKSIFKTCFTGCLISHFTPVHNKQGLFGLDVRSFAIEKMSEFSIICSIEYCDYESLKSLFSDYTEKYMTLDTAAISLLINRTKNYRNAYDAKIINFHENNTLNKITFIASKSIFQKENFSVLFDEFLEILNKGYFDIEFITLFNNFIVNASNRDLEIVEENQFKKLVDTIININLSHTNQSGVYDFNRLNSLFKNSISLLKELKSSIMFDKVIANKLTSGVGDLQFIYIFDFCNRDAKIIIKSYINKHIVSDTKMYLEALHLNIIEPNKKVEEAILSNLIVFQNNQNSPTRFYPDPYETALYEIINLKLNDNLINPSEFEPFLSENLNVFSFLSDMNAFRYENFNLHWVTQFGFSKQLLKSISENPVAKAKIAEKFKERHNTIGLSKSELDTYFTYFF
ncbi:MAG: SIR2 family protein [Lachnospiraceae bacterium]